MRVDFDFHNIGIGIPQHNVVPLARKAEREIASGHLEDVDRAAIQTDIHQAGLWSETGTAHAAEPMKWRGAQAG